MSETRITVVGIGADGYDGLSPRARTRIESADVVIGPSRVLAALPPAPSDTQRREPYGSPLRETLPDQLANAQGDVVVLASGDPLLSGVATTLLSLGFPVQVEPGVSSVALARARMGWSAESAATVSLVGRDEHRVLRELARDRRIVVLSSDETTPGRLAAMLTEHGWGDSILTVLGDLGTEHESRSEHLAGDWPADPMPRLNIVAVQAAGSPQFGWTPGLPDDAFENDGQLTRRDIRAMALARLAPSPGELLWDIGGGAGSIGIEWMRAHHACQAISIERDVDRAERIERNAARLGVPGLEVVARQAPDVLGDLAAPDAIFVGGGATAPGLLDACQQQLNPGGRLVVHGVTVETEVLLAQCHARHGGELSRISLETVQPLGGFAGWKPARTVVQWSWEKPA